MTKTTYFCTRCGEDLRLVHDDLINPKEFSHNSYADHEPIPCPKRDAVLYQFACTLLRYSTETGNPFIVHNVFVMAANVATACDIFGQRVTDERDGDVFLVHDTGDVSTMATFVFVNGGWQPTTDLKNCSVL